MPYTTVYTTSDQLLLLSIVELLHAEGIPVLADGNLGVANLVLAPISSRGSIQVNVEDGERALELIAGFLGTMGELAEVDEAID